MRLNPNRSTFRRLLRRKGFAGTNILGLPTGIAACILIYGYVHHQLSYDAYHRRAGDIARVTTLLHAPESDMAFATSPYPLAAVLRRDIPGIEAATRIEPTEVMVRQGSEKHKSQNFCYSEPSVFTVFTFTFLEGLPVTALAAPNSIVLSQRMEKRYFGNAPALGKTLIARYSRRELDSSGATGYSLAFEAESLANVHFSLQGLPQLPCRWLPLRETDGWLPTPIIPACRWEYSGGRWPSC